MNCTGKNIWSIKLHYFSRMHRQDTFLWVAKRGKLLATAALAKPLYCEIFDKMLPFIPFARINKFNFHTNRKCALGLINSPADLSSLAIFLSLSVRFHFVSTETRKPMLKHCRNISRRCYERNEKQQQQTLLNGYQTKANVNNTLRTCFIPNLPLIIFMSNFDMLRSIVLDLLFSSHHPLAMPGYTHTKRNCIL